MQLFVYGTLKRGQPRHQFLAGQKFLGLATTQPRYRLFNVGEYPALVPYSDGRPIEGELWDVDDACLRALDEVEGSDQGLYARGPVELQTPHDRLAVVSYFYLPPVEGLADCGTCW